MLTTNKEASLACVMECEKIIVSIRRKMRPMSKDAFVVGVHLFSFFSFLFIPRKDDGYEHRLHRGGSTLVIGSIPPDCQSYFFPSHF